jgi:DNA-binding CsgD family transcriptional regulator
MNDTDVRYEKGVSRGLVVLFTVVLALSLTDLLGDAHEGSVHIALEGSITVVAFVGVAWALTRARRLVRFSQTEAATSRARADAALAETTVMKADLAASREEAARWKKDNAALTGGLSAAIDQQLERWALTPAEKEVALLLLKGLSHRDVAEIRQVSETTVRQQARALYRKAGLDGRADLAAFFLEDLLSGTAPTSDMRAP